MIYDVFLSYNQQDGTAVEEIAHVLQAFNLKVFFDPDVPPSGISGLQPNMMTAINNSRCFALLHGPHCLGETQRKEADYAAHRIPFGLDFKNVILVPCTGGAPHGLLRPYETHYSIITGSPFKLVHRLVEWLSPRLQRIGTYRLCGVGPERTVVLHRIPQPDLTKIVELDWQTYGALVSNLLSELDRRAIRPDVVFGINESGLSVAGFLAAKLERKPIGYLKHENNAPRRILADHFALPRLSPEPNRTTDVLLVDSELKTGGALEQIVPELRSRYADSQLRIYYAALFAQLNHEYWGQAGLPSQQDPISYRSLLAASKIESLGLAEVVFGGLFGEGRLDPPLRVR